MFLYQTTCLKKNNLNLVRFDEIGQNLQDFCFYTTYLKPFGYVSTVRFQTIFTNSYSLRKYYLLSYVIDIIDFINYFLKIFQFNDIEQLICVN